MDISCFCGRDSGDLSYEHGGVCLGNKINNSYWNQMKF